MILSTVISCASISRYQPSHVKAPASVHVDSHREVTVDQVIFQFELKQIDTNTLMEVEVTNQGDNAAMVAISDLVLTTDEIKLLPLRKMGRYDASGKYVPIQSLKDKFEIKGSESSKVIFTFLGPAPRPDQIAPDSRFKLKGHLTNGAKTVPLSIDFLGAP